MGKFGSTFAEELTGYNWISSLVFSTLAVMIIVAPGARSSARLDKPMRNEQLYTTCWWASAAFFLSIALILLLEPGIPLRIQDLLALSSIALTPFQAVVVGLIGKLFFENVETQPTVTNTAKRAKPSIKATNPPATDGTV
jgi:hypothetical protein